MDEARLTMRAMFSLGRDERGTSAIEFAIVGPVFLGLVIGMIYLCMMLFSMGSLQYAVEDAARCYSVRALMCPDPGTTVAYAQSTFLGVVTPRFTASTAACGHQVTGAATFNFNYVIGNQVVPLSASACFP